MFCFVIGGAGSGKSAYAEHLAAAAPGPRYYLATMQPGTGPETAARIARHRAMRAGKGFVTIERPLDLAGLRLPGPGTVLLEDLSNLAANERYAPGGAGAAALPALLAGVEALLAQSTHLVVVANEIFSGGADYAGDTGAYLQMLAAAHRALAARADAVCEVVCGLPVWYKGKEPDFSHG